MRMILNNIDNERMKHYMTMKLKGLKGKDIANYIGCSESLISRYFKNDCNISAEKEDKLVEFIYKIN